MRALVMMKMSSLPPCKDSMRIVQIVRMLKMSQRMRTVETVRTVETARTVWVKVQ